MEANRKFNIGDRVRKHSGSWWEGRVVGFYSTEDNPLGYDIQLDMVPRGPVQIYPEAALELAPPTPEPHLEPVAWYRDPEAWVFHLSLGPSRPANNTSDPDEWSPLYATPAPVPHLRGYEGQEAVCTEAAMSQWERSLKRPDMAEKDRVRGAIEAYKRQAFVFAHPPEPLMIGVDLSTREDVTVWTAHPPQSRPEPQPAIGDQEWCQPGDIRKRQFLVTFDDPDCRNAVFEDETEARRFWAKASLNWNCYLFGALLANPAPQMREVGE